MAAGGQRKMSSSGDSVRRAKTKIPLPLSNELLHVVALKSPIKLSLIGVVYQFELMLNFVRA
jgi:hypothetical protein